MHSLENIPAGVWLIDKFGNEVLDFRNKVYQQYPIDRWTVLGARKRGIMTTFNSFIIIFTKWQNQAFLVYRLQFLHNVFFCHNF